MNFRDGGAQQMPKVNLSNLVTDKILLEFRILLVLLRKVKIRKDLKIFVERD